jgi:transposase
LIIVISFIDGSEKLIQVMSATKNWALVAPDLALMTEDAPQRDFPLREIFNGFRRIAPTGAPWRWAPHDLPPRRAIHQQCYVAFVFQMINNVAEILA